MLRLKWQVLLPHLASMFYVFIIKIIAANMN